MPAVLTHRRRRVTAGRGLALLAAAGLAVAGLAVAGLALAGCSTSPTASRAPASRTPLAARYLMIARPANHRLEVAVDGYAVAQRDDLTRARADLRAEAATERQFDARLLAIRFPVRIERTARALVRANQVRIALADRQASAPTLTRMRRLDSRPHAADGAVEARVRQIRAGLGLPPPSNS